MGTTAKPPQPAFTCTADWTLFWLKIRPKWGSFSAYPAQTTVPESNAHYCDPEPGASTSREENLETGDLAKPKPMLADTTVPPGGKGKWRDKAHLQTEGRLQRLSKGCPGPTRGTGDSGWSDVRKDGSQGRQGRPLPVTLKSGYSVVGAVAEVELRGGHMHAEFFSHLFKKQSIREVRGR